MDADYIYDCAFACFNFDFQFVFSKIDIIVEHHTTITEASIGEADEREVSLGETVDAEERPEQDIRQFGADSHCAF